MNLSELCIRRPVMTILLTVALILAGLAAYRELPVAALPRVEFPTISVSAVLPGASPESMASSVTALLEREFSTIAGVETITSSSGLGSSSIALEFALDRDIDAAAADVQAALARAARRLPIEMTTPPSYRKVNPANQAIVLLTMSSDTLPLSEVNDYADLVITPRLSTLNGVAQVQVFGPQKFAVRVQLNPTALAARGIGIDEVQSALVAANANTPVGTLNGDKQQFTLESNSQPRRAAGFRDLIVAYRHGAAVRLGDVATVLDSVENSRLASWYNGTRAIVLGVQRQPDANTVDVVDRVIKLLPEFRAELPPAIKIDVMADRSQSIRAAVHDVQITLALTVALVILVIFVFLRRLSATLIPAMALPVSLIATFGGMYLLGYSIDNLSLLGLTLSVGLVVDDAIVVLENIVRYVEKGMPPWQAAIKGSREVGFTIISITVSLIAVFIPILLMGGVVGRVFREFAMVVTIAIVLSAVVSLTLTPMLCSRMLRAERQAGSGMRRPGWFERIAEAGFAAWLGAYRRSLAWSLRHRLVMIVVMLATVVATVQLFRDVPKGFFPIEDTGQLFVNTEAAQDISFPAMAQLQQKVAAIVGDDPAVEAVTSTIGAAGSFIFPISNGRMFVSLKPIDQRPPIGEVIQQLRRKLAAIPGIAVYLQPIQNLRIGGRSSRNLYQYTVQGLDLDELYVWSDRLSERLKQMPILQDVTDDSQRQAQNVYIDIDRDQAARLGVSVDLVRASLYSAFGTRQISTIYTPRNDYAVVMELEPQYQQDPAALSRIHVRSSTGKLVPLDAFAHVVRTVGPLTVNHQAQLPAVTLSFNLAPGHALGEAVDAIRQVEQEIVLPATISTRFAGTAQVFQDALAGQGLLLAAAVVVIYIVLGVLYESFVHPLTILSGLPSAAVGALLTLIWFRQDLSVIAMIGILMLIGIVKKNAIMMIDFALVAQREHGKSPRDAIYDACLLRFRPIMMTTMAAIMGALPIATGVGAAAELRQLLGLVVVGGLVVSQLLTLYITPVLYLLLEDAGRWLGRSAATTGPQTESEPALQPGED
ncbi:MAG: MMPL family transporter [Azospirillum sp.]|nr:MMPL family transporter [Azospirillum sp.]